MKLSKQEFNKLKDARELLTIAQHLIHEASETVENGFRRDAHRAFSQTQIAYSVIWEGLGIEDDSTYQDYLDRQENIRKILA